MGDLFDFNGNGDLDTIEQAAEFAILQEMMANDDVENENVSTATLQLRTIFTNLALSISVSVDIIVSLPILK